MAARGRPTVAVVGTGGTIANTEAGRIGIDQLLAEIEAAHPQAHPGIHADLRVDEVLREGAETFTPTEWVEIGKAVQSHVDDEDVDAVIVTHGTFTAEETAYFLHLAVRTHKPIVVTCSQRRHGMIGNDGDRNLLDSVRVATSPEARGLGVVVVLNEEIHSAREVTKTNQRPSGFASGSLGILGSVEEDRVSFYRRPIRRHTADSEFAVPSESLPRVDIVAAYAGADGTAIEAFVAAGAQGIVVNGFSYDGKPHRMQLPALEAATGAGVAVVLTNRGGHGRIPVPDRDAYVRGDTMTAQKARVLLSLALSQAEEVSALQRIFNQY